ncbi:tetratricopeptide repeat protein [Helicobacter sp. 11S02596-1]|uniref:tetratricopeptide repeat protein n=1 Tax=Helicobacter sp. 11S02596-1 TaxID=1476194 RepID=UPI000BA4F937|nr:tetratricopeptide repeat protein [Helicobacter sp. 11S02596-1]PAF45080.1 hypothetical protein BJI48_00485 [Helicobacter sp. 11S02596-1]
MSFKTITLASIYELQGFKEEALEIYENILKTDPDNHEAKSGIKRLSENAKTPKPATTNIKAKELFIHASSQEELKTFERWLLQWN